MKRIFLALLLVLACSYTATYGQNDKKKKEAKQEESKKDTTLGDQYKNLGKDIKKTSEATWDETKKAGGEAWQETKNATGDLLESIGDWSKKSSKKVKGEK